MVRIKEGRLYWFRYREVEGIDEYLGIAADTYDLGTARFTLKPVAKKGQGSGVFWTHSFRLDRALAIERIPWGGSLETFAVSNGWTITDNFRRFQGFYNIKLGGLFLFDLGDKGSLLGKFMRTGFSVGPGPCLRVRIYVMDSDNRAYASTFCNIGVDMIKSFRAVDRSELPMFLGYTFKWPAYMRALKGL